MRNHRHHEYASSDEKIERSGNRGFGILFSVVFLLISIYLYYFSSSLWFMFTIFSAVTALISWRYSNFLQMPNRLWIKFGLLIAKFTTPIVMGIVFFLVVTPMGIAMRLAGRDPMRRRFLTKDPSYWIKRDPPGPRPRSMPRQF